MHSICTARSMSRRCVFPARTSAGQVTLGLDALLRQGHGLPNRRRYTSGEVKVNGVGEGNNAQGRGRSRGVAPSPSNGGWGDLQGHHVRQSGLHKIGIV